MTRNSHGKRRLSSDSNDASSQPNKSRRLDVPGQEAAGQIELIRLTNILCHSHLDFSPSRNINLVQGKNGSGKSSIVASIIAGFGGSSQMADRGKTVKNLIQYGKTQAVIEIHLRNEGLNSYKPNTFGNKIIVERKIVASGNGHYKLKAEDGTVVSKKKEDIIRMLTRFNIQVDNPVVVLSQERAKTFLAHSTPSNLFKFYMLSTGLQQISDDYGQLQQDLASTENLVNVKKKNLKKMLVEVKMLEEKRNAIASLQKRKEKLSFLNNEIAWAKVIQKEKELAELQKQESKQENLITKLNGAIKLRSEFKTQKMEEQQKLNEESEELTKESSLLQKERNKASQLHVDKKKSYSAQMNRLSLLKKERHQKQMDVEAIRTSLEKDHESAHSSWLEDKKRLDTEKEQLKSQMAEITARCETEASHCANLSSKDQLNSELLHLTMEHKMLKRRLVTLQTDLEKLNRQGANKLMVFGSAVPQILADIEVAYEQGRFDKKPIGPIGSLVKVKDQQWAHIAERVIGNNLKSFIVTSQRDLRVLKEIFRNRISNRSEEPGIINSKFRDKLHDVEKYEVQCSQFPSLWSILEISDMQVANTLLDLCKVESILLIPRSDQAGDLLKDKEQVPVNCAMAYTLHGDMYYPDPNYKIYSGNGNKKVNYLEASVESVKKDFELNIKHTAHEVEKSQQEVQEKKEQIKQIEREYASSIEKQRKYNAAIHQFQRKLTSLRDQEKPPPPDLLQLQTDLKEHEIELQKLAEEEEELRAESVTTKEQYDAASSEKRALSEKTEGAIQKVSDLKAKLLEVSEQLNKAHIDIRQYELKKSTVKQQQKSKLEHPIEEIRKSLEKKLNNLEHVERIDTKRNPEQIEREKTALKNAIEQEELRQGDLKEINASCQEKLIKFQRVREELDLQIAYTQKLTASLARRKMYLASITRFIDIYLQSGFTASIRKRNITGDIVINHESKTLNIYVQKNTGASTGSNMQSLAMMSGGEKSFATISFILALWNVTCSPFRIMDEFDVFMDNVSRQQCIELLVNAMKPMHQYILVSPLNYAQKHALLSTFRMPDPREENIDSSLP